MSYDFMFDRCANGEQLKCLTVTDEFTKAALAIEVDARNSPRGKRGDVAPGQRTWRAGNTAVLHGPEFVSDPLLSWITQQGIATATIDTGKPWQNGVDESFKGKLRDECLTLDSSVPGPRQRW